jgi:hypothetical protein
VSFRGGVKGVGVCPGIQNSCKRSTADEELGVQEITAFQGELRAEGGGRGQELHIGYSSMAKRNFRDRPLKRYQLRQWM